MRKFEFAEIEVLNLDVVDVTTSTTCASNCPDNNDTEEDWG